MRKDPDMFKKILSFVLLLMVPQSIVDVLNEADEADELSLLKSAGFTVK